MRKLWEHVFSAICDPLLWAGERAGMARRRGYLMGQASGRVLELGAGTGLHLTSGSSSSPSRRPRWSRG